MIRVRIHGRGGQGARVAAKLIGRAAFANGYETQDFAIYGAERRGAPLQAFVRISKEKILERGYIAKPTHLLILDYTLPKIINVFSGISKETVTLINCPEEKDVEFKSIIGKVYAVDAEKIALETFGKKIYNTAMVGAFSQICKIITIKNLEYAIRAELKRYGSEVVKKNIEAAKKAAKEIRVVKK
ncbi:MAG: pyruvate ferredoxin oxidoreductase [Candidatus Iainarchaeum archaeon]|uniref:pyruvate synthase n=1 Tax=Candidatus Iainarchaeum sp. TaxID=3101447 RepID=A0A497JI30_9ARCH|nr:MAG: pyruvate ferredoxin oxidoreductase [Candidatus Diapherotrites archaeon]